MFRPSNPNDHHLTMLELQDWERQQDSKKDDFPFISLSRKELGLLNSTSHGLVEITAKNKSAAYRLRDLVLIRILKSATNIEICEIRGRGMDYLMYIQGIKSQKRVETVRYWITTGIAVIALILSLAALLWQGYTWTYELRRSSDTSSSCAPTGSTPVEAQQEQNLR